MSIETALRIIETSPSPIDGQPDGARALVRVVETADADGLRMGHKERVTFGVARNQGVGGAWVVRKAFKTLAKARIYFAGHYYP